MHKPVTAFIKNLPVKCQCLVCLPDVKVEAIKSFPEAIKFAKSIKVFEASLFESEFLIVFEKC